MKGPSFYTFTIKRSPIYCIRYPRISGIVQSTSEVLLFINISKFFFCKMSISMVFIYIIDDLGRTSTSKDFQYNAVLPRN